MSVNNDYLRPNYMTDKDARTIDEAKARVRRANRVNTSTPAKPIYMTLGDLKACDEAKVYNRTVPKEELIELNRKVVNAVLEMKSWNNQGQEKTDQVNIPASIVYQTIPPEIEPAEERQELIEVEEGPRSCLFDKSCHFAQIVAVSITCVITLIAAHILGPLGALMSFCSGALGCGLLKVAIDRYLENQARNNNHTLGAV